MTQRTIIPLTQLSRDALEGVIDDFLSREGANCDHAELTLNEQRARVRLQVTSGDVIILFEPKHGTCSLIRRNDLAIADGSPAASHAKRATRGSDSAATQKHDALILTYLIADDRGALEQLRAAGLSAHDVRARATAIGLTIDLIRRLKVSGKPATIRTCLKCDATFASSGSQNRLCTRCRG